MILYCWSTVTGAIDDIPRAMGVAKDRERAMEAAERYLRSGEGLLSLVEAVRP
ncbi:MAG: hypothetical protein JO242_16555, partial [Streptosporangiaceae bacterium]|nr:hypothetical protein [Streptosporangiaceae bacterium]